MSPIAGFVQFDLGHRREQIDKTDEYPGEPGTLLKPGRLIDGDDPTKQTWLQAGISRQDNEVVLHQQLSTILGRGHLHLCIPGVVRVTPSGFDFALYVSGTAGATVTIYELQATGVSVLSSGTTLLRVNANTIASGVTTSLIDLSIAAAAQSGKASGSFELTVGDLVYVQVITAGGHRNLNVNIAYKGGGIS